MDGSLTDQRLELRKKILTLEWDKNIGNINFSKDIILEDCRKQLIELEAKLQTEVK